MTNRHQHYPWFVPLCFVSVLTRFYPPEARRGLPFFFFNTLCDICSFRLRAQEGRCLVDTHHRNNATVCFVSLMCVIVSHFFAIRATRQVDENIWLVRTWQALMDGLKVRG